MKINAIKPFLVDRCLLVRVYTDEGIVGTGEAGLWAHHRLVYESIGDLSEYYVGQDPARVEHHFQVVSRNTHFMGSVLSAAMSAIDVALWDILARSVDLPVYKSSAAGAGTGSRSLRTFPGTRWISAPRARRRTWNEGSPLCGRRPFSATGRKGVPQRRL